MNTPIDFSDKELTMCSFLSLVFWLPCILRVFDSFIVDVLFDRRHYSLNIGFFFVHIQTLRFYEHLEKNFLLEPACWDLRNCTICQQLLFNTLIWVSGGIWSLFCRILSLCVKGMRTLHPWLQLRRKSPSVRVAEWAHCQGTDESPGLS